VYSKYYIYLRIRTIFVNCASKLLITKEMKNILLLTIVTALMLSSCNFLERTFNKKKRQRELLEQMRLDSIAKAKADSIQMAEELQRQLEQARLDSIRLAEEAELAKRLTRYHVIAGSFKVLSNAQSFAKNLSCDGFEPQILEGKSGYTYVSVGAYESFSNAANMVREIRDNGKYIVWIHRPN